jgi:hypothetical protein
VCGVVGPIQWRNFLHHEGLPRCQHRHTSALAHGRGASG